MMRLCTCKGLRFRSDVARKSVILSRIYWKNILSKSQNSKDVLIRRTKCIRNQKSSGLKTKLMPFRR